jgi:hypothetical protein
MDFEIEMIVPPQGIDDLGQMAKASITFLRYQLSLGYKDESMPSALGRLDSGGGPIVHQARRNLTPFSVS